MGRWPLNVTLSLDYVHCLDEGDGSGNAEPYLWTLFYKIDGDTCRLNALNMTGTVTVHRTNGEHGNLQDTSVEGGDTVPIPSSIGKWNTVLQPIPLVPPLPGLAEDVAGVVGVVCVLMEEDNLPDSAAVAGYNAFCSSFETQMNAIIPTLGLSQQDLTEENEKQIQDAIQQAITDAMTNDLSVPEKIWNWAAGPDQRLGSASFKYTGGGLPTWQTKGTS